MTNDSLNNATSEPTVHRADFHVSSPDGVSVTINTVAQSSDLWHRVLNELHDLGIVADLSDAAYRVLGVFLRFNCARAGGTLDPRTGLVYADIDRLMAATRRSRTYVYKGRSELLSHPRSLLAERERDRFLVLPGWSWAGRADSPAPARSASPPRIFQSPIGDQKSPSGDGKSPMGDESSAIADGPGAPQRQRARGLNSETGIDDNNSQRAVVVNLLIGAGIGFKANEAASLAGLPDIGPDRVINAIAGARRVREEGKLKVGKHRDADHCMRSWIARALEKKWDLFDQAAADRYASERRASNTPRLIEDLKAKLAGVWRGDPDNLAFDEQTHTLQLLGGWEGALAALPSWKNLSGARIREILMVKAEAMAMHKAGVRP